MALLAALLGLWAACGLWTTLHPSEAAASSTALDARQTAVCVRGYTLPGRYPTVRECNRYLRNHRGVERWRLWVRRYAHRQARRAGHGTWRYVWNETWVLRVMVRESGGNPKADTNPPYLGLLQIDRAHSRRNLLIGWLNIAIGAQLFTRRGDSPWACTTNVGVCPYVRRK